MSTAARPTYFAAIGRSTYGGVASRQTSGKDQIAHTKLKYRVVGQASVSEMKVKNLKTDLEQQEAELSLNRGSAIAMIENEKRVDVTLLLRDKPEIDEDVLKKYDDADVDVGSDGFDSSSEEEDNGEEDEEAELMKELERIKEEKAAALAKKEKEQREVADQMSREAALKSNPLVSVGLTGDSLSAKVKRRWNDDVVFRNQTKDEPEQKKRFINDTIRSDFHRSFLKKYIK